jgi:hypothetical protein
MSEITQDVALVRATTCETMYSRTMWVRDLSAARLRSLELRRARFEFLQRGCATRNHQAKRGGARRDRTDDLMLAKHALSQLSYGPVFKQQRPSSLSRASPGTPRFVFSVAAPRVAEGEAWWAWEDLNFRPHAYQARALTN